MIGTSVCPHRLSSEPCDQSFTKFFMHNPRGPVSVLLWRHCDTLCTSSFVDVVTFGSYAPYGVFQHWGEFDVYACLAQICIPDDRDVGLCHRHALRMFQGHLVQDPVTMVRVTYAENIALLAETALRSHFTVFIESSSVLQKCVMFLLCQSCKLFCLSLYMSEF